MPLKPTRIEILFGHFTYQNDATRKGAIIIATDWIREHLTRITVPIPLRTAADKPVVHITCHRLIAEQLACALKYLGDQNLTDHLHTWDGCWVPRHMVWNPAKPLSSHSWGIAFDINASQFPYGQRLQQDPGIVNAFARFGFEWGGSWRVPDPMHFEFIGLQADSPAGPTEPAVAPLKVIVNDVLVSSEARFESDQVIAPLRPIVEALGGSIAYHPDQRKVYIYHPLPAAPPQKGTSK